jgi:hypothetical protein
MTIRFVLASASPARRTLLDSAGIPHIAMASDFDEDSVKAEPMLFVQILAKAKAETILAKLDSPGPSHLPGLADWEPWGEGAVEVRVMEDFEMDPEPKPPSKESELFDPVTVRGSWDDESEDGELVGCGRDYAAPAMRDLPVDW